ncbi:hypothetical protein [Myxococcus sp. Y35]|uniref:hypothetical protein n=1 Tax=Pseudomyxococcus flavus TaxID=3115648 RepID=UPI003CE7CF6F
MDGKYTNGNPVLGQEATVCDADALNALQEEPCTVIEAEGIALEKGNNGQLLQALDSRFGRKATANTWQGAQTFSAAVTANNGGPSVQLKPGTIDHVYLEFFARTSAPNTRSGFLGYGAAGSSVLALVNSLSGGDVEVTPGSGGKISLAGSTQTSAPITVGGTTPASNTAFTNTLTKANIVKAWGRINVSGGTATLQNGFNVASVAASGTAITVNLAGTLSSNFYTVSANKVVSAGIAENPAVGVHSMGTSSFAMSVYDTSFNPLNVSSGSHAVMFVVLGHQ